MKRILFIPEIKKSCVVTVILVSAGMLCPCALVKSFAHNTPATQGDFAVKLVEKLGLGGNMSEDKAIETLSALSISPGSGPQDEWQKQQPATQKFIAQIQAAVQSLLKETAVDLNIPPPPTLDLYVIEVPPPRQRLYLRAEPDLPGNAVAAGGQDSSEASPESPSHSNPPPSILPPGAPPELSPLGHSESSATIGGAPPMPPPETLNPSAQAPAEIPPSDKRAIPKTLETGDHRVDAKIDDRVAEAIVKQEWVPVIVVLRSNTQPDQNSSGEAERLVAEAQQRVLRSLSPDEFRLKHRFETVYGFAGWVSRQGLIQLQSNPDVELIQYDGLDAPQ